MMRQARRQKTIDATTPSGDTDLPTAGAILGFVVMMILDVALG